MNWEKAFWEMWDDEPRWKTDINGQIVEKNAAFDALYDCAQECIKWRDGIEAACKEGKRVRIKSSGYRLVFLPLYSETGELCGSIGAARVDLLDEIEQNVMVVNNEQKLTYFNAAAAAHVRRVGVKLEIGANLGEIVGEIEKNGVLERYERALSGETVKGEREFYFQPADVAMFQSYLYKPLVNPMEPPNGVLLVFQNVTGVRLQEIEVEEKNRRLELQKERLVTLMEESAAIQKALTAARREIEEQNTWLKSILDSADALVLALDGDYKIKTFNRALSDFMPTVGLHSPLAGGDLEQIFSTKGYEESIRSWEIVMNGEKFSRESTVRLLNGENVTFLTHLSPVINQNGQTLGACMFARDVTEQKRLQDKLSEQNILLAKQRKRLKKRLETLQITQELLEKARQFAERKQKEFEELLDASHDMIITIDKDWKVRYINAAHREYLLMRGLPQYVGMEYAEMIPAHEWEKITRFWKIAFNGASFSTKTTFRFEGFPTQEYEMRFNPLLDEDGNVYRAVLFVRDVTEVEAAKRQIEAQNEELNARLDALIEAQKLAESRKNEIEAIINSTDDYIYAYDPDFCVIHFNHATEKLWQAQGVQLAIGMCVRDTMTPEIKTPVDKALKGETTFQEIEFQFPNGKTRVYYTTYAPIYADDSKYIRGAVGFARDVTARKLIEIELQRKNRELEIQADVMRQKQAIIERRTNEINTIINSSQDLIAALDTDFTILYFNDAFKNILAENNIPIALGESYFSVVDPRYADTLRVFWERAFAGETFTADFVYEFEDRKQNIYYAFSFAPFRDENGTIMGAIGFSRDITTLKLFALEIQEKNLVLESQSEELRQNLEQLEVVNRSLNEAKFELEATLNHLKAAQTQLVQSEKMSSLGVLTAGIAHEINNPINFVYGGVDALRENIEVILSVADAYDKIQINAPLEDVLRALQAIETQKNKTYYAQIRERLPQLVDMIKIGAGRTAEIVRSLKNFSRLDEAEVKIAHLHESLDTSLLLLNARIKNRVTVIKNYDPRVDYIECYAGQLNQVYMNILFNALQAMENNDTENPSLTITTLKNNESVDISIKDNGPGVPREIIEHIFEPFFTTKEVGKGTGLGLSISYSIVERHEGRIVVVSKPGLGAEFIIKLPLKQRKKSKV